MALSLELSYNATRFEQGHKVWHFEGYKTVGINHNNGEPIYMKANGDTTSVAPI